MGWRSWNLFDGHVSQALLLQQVAGLVRVRHEGVSLRDLGYATVGLDDGWQDCSSGNGYHDPTTGAPKINDKFPDMRAMTTAARQLNVSMGWYGNNCGARKRITWRRCAFAHLTHCGAGLHDRLPWQGRY